MSNTGAIPKGGARSKTGSNSTCDPNKQQKDADCATEPLDKKFILASSDGVEERKLALHKDWIEAKSYIHYCNPPIPDDSGTLLAGAMDSWLENMDFLKQDLTDLLEVEHHRFWSQVVYDPSIHQCLDSYLCNSPRWYEDNSLDEVTTSTIETVHQLVFLIFLRMATYKETKKDHITPEVWGQIIYDHFLFDMCKLLDLCVLYSSTNTPLLNKMISNIFMYQPKYYIDLDEFVGSLKVVLENVELRLGVVDHTTPLTLSSVSKPPSLPELHDITLYLLDTFYSLQCLIQVFPDAALPMQIQGFEIRLSTCYEQVIPTITKEVAELAEIPETRVWALCLLKRLKVLRSTALLTFRSIVNRTCFDCVIKPSVETVSECTERYVHIISTCVGERNFIVDYNTIYSVKKDLELLQHVGADATSVKFIQEAIQTVVDEMITTEPIEKLSIDQTSEKEKPPDDNSGMNGYLAGQSSEISSVEMVSLVSNIQDLFPDLGIGFIHECLRYFHHSSEEVVNALLENNLPPSLKSLDHNLTIPPTQPTTPRQKSNVDTVELQSSETDTVKSQDNADKQTFVSARQNIYKDDEFDVFSRTSIDMTKVHKGKRKMINEDKDSSLKEKVKEIGRQYEERSGYSIYEDELRYTQEANNYEDEYDDTYDDVDPGNIDETGIGRLAKSRPTLRGKGSLNAPGILNGNVSESDEEQSEKCDHLQHNSSNNSSRAHSEARPELNGDSINRSGGGWRKNTYREDDGGRDNKTTFRPFCENPEAIRERAAQRRMDKDNNRYRGNWNGSASGRTEITSNNPGGETNGETSWRENPNRLAEVNKKSGKSWRQGTDEESNRRPQGGKYQQEGNTHGKAQDKSHRSKMVHKNDFKRRGAQAKFERNN